VAGLAVVLALASVFAVAGGIYLSLTAGWSVQERLQVILAAVLVGGLGLVVSRGVWLMRNWARTAVLALLSIVVIYYGVTVLLHAAGEIFGGERVVPLGEIVRLTFLALGKIALVAIIPAAIFYGLNQTEAYFRESLRQRRFVDQSVRYLLIATALSAIFIVFLIILFTMSEAWDSISEIGLGNMLLGTIWRPGAIAGGDQGQFGLVPMMAGSALATFGAVVLGMPLSVGTVSLLPISRLAPSVIRCEPAVELLAGIPRWCMAVRMVELAPLIAISIALQHRALLLNASNIQAVMILPTVTISPRTPFVPCPRDSRRGLWPCATHWQTIVQVICRRPSGIVAA
jgi:phosphate transport system permease protein